jgi:hypothetical protein
MDKILIIRSVSLQQLDQNLPVIRAAFPGAEFHLLTHPHAIAECCKYPGLARVIPLSSAASFSPFRLPAEIRAERYSAVVVPVANRSGAGFLNVFLTAWRCRSKAIYRCNLVSEIDRIGRTDLLFRWFGAWGFRLATLGLFIPLIPLALVTMLLGRLLAGRRPEAYD